LSLRSNRWAGISQRLRRYLAPTLASQLRPNSALARQPQMRHYPTANDRCLWCP